MSVANEPNLPARGSNQCSPIICSPDRPTMYVKCGSTMYPFQVGALAPTAAADPTGCRDRIENRRGARVAMEACRLGQVPHLRGLQFRAGQVWRTEVSRIEEACGVAFPCHPPPACSAHAATEYEAILVTPQQAWDIICRMQAWVILPDSCRQISAKSFGMMVARDGVEPPTPAFSEPRF